MQLLLPILADTSPQTDFMISGNWLVGALAILIPVIIAAWFKGKQTGKTEATDNNVTLKKPVPTIQTREEPRWATKPELVDHIAWTRDELGRVWDQFGTEREIHNGDLNNMHERLNKQSTAVAGLMGAVEKIDQNVNRLLDIQLGKPNGSTKR
jgi:hypothetical protein